MLAGVAPQLAAAGRDDGQLRDRLSPRAGALRRRRAGGRRRRRDRARPAGRRGRPNWPKICRRADFSLVQLVTPTTPRERALRIAENSTGFLYYVSVTGITGERSELPQSLIDNVGWLREQTTAADLHRLRHQHARARATVGPRGRRPDRRHRPSSAALPKPRASRAMPCWPTSATTSPHCSPRSTNLRQALEPDAGRTVRVRRRWRLSTTAGTFPAPCRPASWFLRRR